MILCHNFDFDPDSEMRRNLHAARSTLIVEVSEMFTPLMITALSSCNKIGSSVFFPSILLSPPEAPPARCSAALPAECLAAFCSDVALHSGVRFDVVSGLRF